MRISLPVRHQVEPAASDSSALAEPVEPEETVQAVVEFVSGQRRGVIDLSLRGDCRADSAARGSTY